MRAVPTWVDKVHDRERNEQVCAEVVANGGSHNLQTQNSWSWPHDRNVKSP